MKNLTIAWILLDLPFILILQGLFEGVFNVKYENEKEESMVRLFTMFFLWQLVWWGIYFLIK